MENINGSAWNVKSLHKYWRNKITVPAECADVENSADEDANGEEDNEFIKPTKPVTTTPPITATPTTTPQPNSTALHSTTLLKLEYELCESIALSSIIINISDLFGSDIDPSAKSHVAWVLLHNQYGKMTDHARNM